MKKYKAGTMLIAIILLGFFLRIFFFTGMGSSDDLTYSDVAHSIADGAYQIKPDHPSLRWGLVFPTALVYRYFGANDITATLFVLIASMGSIFVAFYIGKLLFNDKVGLAAAFLMAIFPFEVVNSTRLYSENPMSFFAGLCMLFFFFGQAKNRKINYLMSGFFLGIAYLVRESVLILLLPIAIYAMYKKNFKSLHFFLMGLLLIMAAESLAYFFINGNPFFRFHAITSSYGNVMAVFNYYGNTTILQRLFLVFPYMLLRDVNFGFFYAFGFMALLYLIIYREKESYNVLIWFVPLFLYIYLGTMSIKTYLPFIPSPRFLSLLTLPLVVMLAVFICDNDKAIKKAIAPSLLILLFVSSIGLALINSDRFQTKNARLAYEFVKAQNNPVYSDERTTRIFEFLSGYKSSNFLPFHKYDYLNPYSPSKNVFVLNLKKLNSSYVVLNNNMLRVLPTIYHDMEFPEEAHDIPKNWKLVKEFGKNEDKISVYFTG